MEASYIGVHLWAQAVAIADTDRPRTIARALRGQSFDAPEGTVRVDSDNQHTCKTCVLGQIVTGGQFDVIGRSAASSRTRAASLTYAAARMAKKKKAVRRKKQAAASIGLSPADTRTGTGPADALTPVVERGGQVLGAYRDPFGGKPMLMVSLPIDRVEPTPFQRDPSEPHVKRLMTVIETLGRFLDPLIVVRHDDRYWTPNGNHRLQAMRRLGAKAVIALLIPEPEVAYQILALNTEKAHNLREKSLETIRMARGLAEDTREPEEAYAFQFEEPAFLTLGAAYESRPRLSGAVYRSVLRRIDEFLDKPLSKAVAERERRARIVLAIDDRVTAIVDKLKARGLTSPYLRSFVVARINPIRFSKATSFDFDEVMDKMSASAGKFNIDRVKPEEVTRAAGPPAEED
jgi:ParB family transcriptional regulator, chromosome partitioning protein